MATPKGFISWLEPNGTDIHDDGGPEEELQQPDGTTITLPSRGPWPDDAFVTVINQMPPEVIIDIETLMTQALEARDMTREHTHAWIIRLGAYAAKTVIGFKGSVFQVRGDDGTPRAPALPENDLERVTWMIRHVPTPVLTFISREVDKLGVNPLALTLSALSSASVSGPSSTPASRTETASPTPNGNTEQPSESALAAV